MRVFIGRSGELIRIRRLILLAALRLVCVALLAVSWLTVPSVVVGDIAPDPLSGGVNFSGSTDQVEMSEEAVTLNVTATRCDTNGLFQMKNLTDAPVTMEVGFPFAYPDDLRDFKVKVDGKTIENVADKSVGKRQKWKVWTMTFPAGKVTAVEVDYWNKLTAKYSWVSGIDSVPNMLLGVSPLKAKPTGQATEEEQRQFNELAARLQHREVRYILKTGAGWAGKIGKCRIEAKFGGFTWDNLITRFPWKNESQVRDPQIHRERLVWELVDFEPKDDIFFQISPHITRRELWELIEVALKNHPHHPQLTLLYGEFCEFPVEKQRHQRMMDDMLASWSTRLAIDGPDYVDKEHAQHSFRVWFVVRDLTIYRRNNESLSEARRKKLLPTIKALAQRMQSQLPPKGQATTDRLNKNQVTTFRLESQKVLEWVEEEK